MRLVVDTRESAIGVPYGLGIDENTALVIRNDGTLDAEGEVCHSLQHLHKRYNFFHERKPPIPAPHAQTYCLP